MTQRDAVDRLLTAFPQTETWPPMRGESYGPRWDDLSRGQAVGRVLYAVTCTPEVEALFVRDRYDLLVLHHPMRPVDPLPHVVLHTPLDCGVGGLNDLWRDALGIQDARHITDNLGWYGPVKPQTWKALMARVQAFVGRVNGQVYVPVSPITSVAVCAGLGGWVAREAFETGADVFITGELTQLASRVGCRGVIEVGHTRSERIGVQAIQRVLGPEVRVAVAPLGDDRFGREVYQCAHDTTP